MLSDCLGTSRPIAAMADMFCLSIQTSLSEDKQERHGLIGGLELVGHEMDPHRTRQIAIAIRNSRQNNMIRLTDLKLVEALLS